MSENSIANNKEAIFLALSQIPAGSVITYGQLAQLAGLPGAARLVGHLLRELPEGSNLPWHRVINAQGKLSLPEQSESYKEQTRRLQREGIEIMRGKINLNRFSFARLGIAPLSLSIAPLKGTADKKQQN